MCLCVLLWPGYGSLEHGKHYDVENGECVINSNVSKQKGAVRVAGVFCMQNEQAAVAA